MSHFSNMDEGKKVSDLALKHFLHYFEQLLDGLMDMFPKNENIAKKQAQFLIGIRNMFDEQIKTNHSVKLVESFHTQMSPFYKDVHARNGEFLEDGSTQIMKEMAPLWKQLDQQNRDVIWEYLDLLIQHATCFNMYSKIPEGLRNTISKVTEELEETSKQGGKVDLATMSGKILNGADPDEMKKFAMGMMENKEDLENIFRIAGSQLQKMKS